MCDHQSCNSRRRGSARLDRRQLLAGAAALGLAGATGLRATPARAGAAAITLPKPGPNDTCPVCGMFPARYPEWLATVAYKDGYADHFDGAKDMFKYLADMNKYAKGRKREDITGIGVTSYYASQMIDASAALYVAGSDVYGPMGHELVPHPDEKDAGEFMTDHKGRAQLTFAEVSPAFVNGLDDGKFDKQ